MRCAASNSAFSRSITLDFGLRVKVISSDFGLRDYSKSGFGLRVYSKSYLVGDELRDYFGLWAYFGLRELISAFGIIEKLEKLFRTKLALSAMSWAASNSAFSRSITRLASSYSNLARLV